jgi:flagellar hook-basal body complex protein FliE
MTIEAIGAIGAVNPGQDVDGFLAPARVQEAQAGFGQRFVQEIENINTGIVDVDNDIRKLVAGESPSLHDVMIRMEEAKLSFQLLAQVRNRLLEAYQEVMRMQV